MISTDKQSIQSAETQHSLVKFALNCRFNLLWTPVPCSLPLCPVQTWLIQVLSPMPYPNKGQGWREMCQFQIQTVGQEVHPLTGDTLRLYSLNSNFWLKRVWGFSFLIPNYTWGFRSNSRTRCQTFTEFLLLFFLHINIKKAFCYL